MLEKIIFLFALLILGMISKNHTIILSIIVLIIFVLFRVNNQYLTQIKKYSIDYGLILISIYAFIPIAKGDITLEVLLQALSSWKAWIAIFSGVLVTHFSKNGIEMMNVAPDVTTFVLVGIILGIMVFKGVSSGPIIGSGMALMFYGIINTFIKLFG